MSRTLSRVIDSLESAQDTVADIAEKICSVIQPLHFYIALCIAFFFSTSGVIYNIINNAPPYGQEKDERGNDVVISIAKGIHSQFSTEGYISGSLTVISGLLIVFAMRDLKKPSSTGLRAAIYTSGSVLCCYFIYRRFRYKTGWY